MLESCRFTTKRCKKLNQPQLLLTMTVTALSLLQTLCTKKYDAGAFHGTYSSLIQSKSVISFFSRGWIFLSFHRTSVLLAMDIGSLADCRDLSDNFFLDIVKSSSCLHHFLPPSRLNSITWLYDQYPRFLTHTECDCSLITLLPEPLPD